MQEPKTLPQQAGATLNKDFKFLIQFAVLGLLFWVLVEFVGKGFALGVAALILLSMVVVNGDAVAKSLNTVGNFLK